jgi:hypothetical protein
MPCHYFFVYSYVTYPVRKTEVILASRLCTTLRKHVLGVEVTFLVMYTTAVSVGKWSPLQCSPLAFRGKEWIAERREAESVAETTLYQYPFK